jgi:hypothetical protein
MARAVVPTEMPRVPEAYTRWRRSTRRGAVYHLTDYVGASACGQIRLERNTSEGPRHLGDMQYWGCCPRCFKIAERGE